MKFWNQNCKWNWHSILFIIMELGFNIIHNNNNVGVHGNSACLDEYFTPILIVNVTPTQEWFSHHVVWSDGHTQNWCRHGSNPFTPLNSEILTTFSDSGSSFYGLKFLLVGFLGWHLYTVNCTDTFKQALTTTFSFTPHWLRASSTKVIKWAVEIRPGTGTKFKSLNRAGTWKSWSY